MYEKIFREGFNPYFIGLPILIIIISFPIINMVIVSILILLDYLFLWKWNTKEKTMSVKVSILILLDYLFLSCLIQYLNLIHKYRFNPYFIGLPILIWFSKKAAAAKTLFQSLFYWITYSYIRTC